LIFRSNAYLGDVLRPLTPRVMPVSTEIIATEPLGGVTGSHLFGRLLAEAVAGDSSRFDVFAKLRWFPFPGGRLFREQYCTAGSWWCAVRNALGI
jgi:glycine/D-amino acid oxidase-like deaminating enzyme